MSDREALTIARGGNPTWEHTFKHPIHGELTFRGKLPLAVDSLRHSVALDNRLQELEGVPSVQTSLLAAALAGMVPPDREEAPGRGLLIELPVISRDEQPDEDRGSVRVTTRYYDPEEESDLDFLTNVWLTYSGWRASLLSDSTVSAVGKSSEGPSTPSDESSTPSAEATAPPPTTPAS